MTRTALVILIALALLLFMTLCWYVLPAMWRGT
jgi:hypothetical protein